MLDKKYWALIGHVLYVGVVKFSLVREIVSDGHGRRAMAVEKQGGVKGELEWGSGNAISKTFEDRE